MYIKIREFWAGTWDYTIYTANHHEVMRATGAWVVKSAAVSAAKKMAKGLGIEYRERR